MYRVWNFVTNYSLLLIIGALIALVWANLDAHSYHHFVEYPLLFNDWVGVDASYWVKSYGEDFHIEDSGGALKVLSAHYLVNDVLMALFFAIAAKEVWEAVILKNGSLRGRKAATPLFATAGGMFGPIAVYLGLAAFLGSDVYDAVANGWAIPTATDIAFSYLVGRIVFGAGHPAVRFLLLLAIADDAAGLIILAIFYPSGELAPEWLLLSLGAAVGVFVLFNWLPRQMDRGDQLRRKSTWVRNVLSFWPYLIAACLSWYGFQESGLHPALGLLPIVPTIPHADRAFGIFSEAEQYLTDLLNHIEHMLKHPVLLRADECRCGIFVDRRADLAGTVGPSGRQTHRDLALRLDRGGADAPGAATGNADHRPLRDWLCRRHRLYRVAVHRLGRLRSGPGAGCGQDGSPLQLCSGDCIHRCGQAPEGRKTAGLNG